MVTKGRGYTLDPFKRTVSERFLHRGDVSVVALNAAVLRKKGCCSSSFLALRFPRRLRDGWSRKSFVFYHECFSQESIPSYYRMLTRLVLLGLDV